MSLKIARWSVGRSRSEGGRTRTCPRDNFYRKIAYQLRFMTSVFARKQKSSFAWLVVAARRKTEEERARVLITVTASNVVQYKTRNNMNSAKLSMIEIALYII